MKILLIDDARDIDYINRGWNVKVTHVARTFAEGIKALKENGPFDILLLDHDLDSFDEEKNELTGYMIMIFLEQNLHLLPKKVELVTSNPVGRAKMQVVIDKLYKK